jgi:hypothetical protein
MIGDEKIDEILSAVQNNRDMIRQSKKIFCLDCEEYCIYDGTEQTEPFLWGHNYSCRFCGQFALIGDASPVWRGQDNGLSAFYYQRQRKLITNGNMPLNRYIFFRSRNNIAEFKLNTGYGCYCCGKIARVEDEDMILEWHNTAICSSCHEIMLLSEQAIPQIDQQKLAEIKKLFPANNDADNVDGKTVSYGEHIANSKYHQDLLRVVGDDTPKYVHYDKSQSIGAVRTEKTWIKSVANDEVLLELTAEIERETNDKYQVFYEITGNNLYYPGIIHCEQWTPQSLIDRVMRDVRQAGGNDQITTKEQ